jgi:hypothetical protein
MADVEIDQEALRLFNRLAGRLDIRLSEPAVPVAPGWLNLKAPPSARIEDVSLIMQFSEEVEEDTPWDLLPDPRDLTEGEWSRVVLRAPSIRMRGENDDEVVEHRAPDSGAFTVRDLAAAIADTERRTRGGTSWEGGIDVHHIYFEGIELEEDGVWCIQWGS